MKHLLKITAFALLLTTVVACQKNGLSNGRELIVGDQIPNFSVTTTEGMVISNTDFNNKVGIINFFNSACKDCLSELPTLNNVYLPFLSVDKESEDYKDYAVDNDLLTFVNISRSENESSVKKTWQRLNLKMPVSAQENDAVYKLFASRGIPKTYVILNSRIVAVYNEQNLPVKKELQELILAKLQELKKELKFKIIITNKDFLPLSGIQRIDYNDENKEVEERTIKEFNLTYRNIEKNGKKFIVKKITGTGDVIINPLESNSKKDDTYTLKVEGTEKSGPVTLQVSIDGNPEISDTIEFYVRKRVALMISGKFKDEISDYKKIAENKWGSYNRSYAPNGKNHAGWCSLPEQLQIKLVDWTGTKLDEKDDFTGITFGIVPAEFDLTVKLEINPTSLKSFYLYTCNGFGGTPITDGDPTMLINCWNTTVKDRFWGPQQYREFYLVGSTGIRYYPFTSTSKIDINENNQLVKDLKNACDICKGWIVNGPMDWDWHEDKKTNSEWSNVALTLDCTSYDKDKYDLRYYLYMFKAKKEGKDFCVREQSENGLGDGAPNYWWKYIDPVPCVVKFNQYTN